VNEDGEPDALAQPRQRPLVLEFADHLQQLVGVVVDQRELRTAGDAESGSRDASLGAGVLWGEPFGSFTSIGSSLGGIRSVGASLGAHNAHRLTSSPFSLFSHSGRYPGAKPRLVQWFLIVRRIAGWKGTLFEVVSGSTDAVWKLLLPVLAKLGFGAQARGAARFLDHSRPHGCDSGRLYLEQQEPLLALCLLAAAGSAIGGLLPYGLGRAGGELFLLKRVNRERYERLRTALRARSSWP